MQVPRISWRLVGVAVIAACHIPDVTFNPEGAQSDAADGSVDASRSETTAATCSDGIDNDGNGLTDCADPSCSGIGTCGICGVIEHPLAGGQLIPDGVGGTKCTVPGTLDVCPTDQLCYAIPTTAGNLAECRHPFTSSIGVAAFAPGQTMTAITDLKSVCVTIEHSWMRDLQIDLVAPSGQVIQLDQFLGQSGAIPRPEVYLGNANDCDTDANPAPGTGVEYCWAPTASNPDMIAFANTGTLDTVMNCMGGISNELPLGSYAASAPWSQLVGATLNGDWTLRIADLWAIDNGYLFKWSVAFDPSIVPSCSNP